MRTTRAEVARLAGVSPSVVSYVLNGGPRKVAAETRKRVEEAVAALEYRPNAIAQALRGGRSGILGVVAGDVDSSLMLGLLVPLQRAAVQHGYSFYLALSDDEPSEKAAVRSLVDRQVDGLIMIEPRRPSMLLEVAEDGFPATVMSRRPPRGGVPWCELVHDRTTTAALMALASERPGIVWQTRRAADILELLSPAERPSLVTTVDPDAVEDARRVSAALASGRGAPVAIITATAREAQRLHWALELSGQTRVAFYSLGADLENRTALQFTGAGLVWDLEPACTQVLSTLILALDAVPLAIAPLRVSPSLVDTRVGSSMSRRHSWNLQEL